MIKSIKFVLTEHFYNLYMIGKLGIASSRKQTIRTSLGIWWILIRDIIYFVTFILFRVLMAGSGTIEGMNFILYLVTGLVPWFFINDTINGGVMTIKNSKAIISSIKFPITTLSTIEVIGVFGKRLFTVLILFVLCGIFGDLRDINIFLFIYYFLSMFILMCVYNLMVSPIIAISEDFTQLYLAMTRVLFYVVPVIWSFESLKHYPSIEKVLKLNPMVYIINGFRDALVLGNIPDLQFTIYFWSITIIMFIIASLVQFKLKRYYLDFI